MKKRTRSTAKQSKEPLYELSNGDDSEESHQAEQEIEPKKKAPKKPKKEAKAKKAVDVESYNPNLIKVKNKLVGKVERTDLYDSDDGMNRQEVDLTTNNQ